MGYGDSEGLHVNEPLPGELPEISGGELKAILDQADVKGGKVTFQDRTRPVTEDQWKHVQNALSLLDKEVAGKWPKLTWAEVQKSAATTLVMPSTIHQGKTTTCGAVSTLEAMASYHPEVYARLVLSVWADGRVVTCEGKPWGDTQE